MSSHRLNLVRNRGFTLIELLTVIAIIGILAAILVPVVGKVRSNARNSQCIGNERGLAMAQIAYAGDNKGLFAGGYLAGGSVWQAQLEPYLGKNGRSMLQCPEIKLTTNIDPWSTPSYGINYYLVVANWGRRLSAPPRRVALIGERPPSNDDYYNGNFASVTDAQWPAILRHSSNNNMIMAFTDGSVRGVTRAELLNEDPATSIHKWW